jgi:hypothetical protein
MADRYRIESSWSFFQLVYLWTIGPTLMVSRCHGNWTDCKCKYGRTWISRTLWPPAKRKTTKNGTLSRRHQLLVSTCNKMSSGNIWYLRADVFDLHLHKTYVQDDKPSWYSSRYYYYLFLFIIFTSITARNSGSVYREQTANESIKSSGK